MNIEVDFGAWNAEEILTSLNRNGCVSALAFLTALEQADEDELLEAMELLDGMGAELDVADLPKASGTGEAAVRLRREEELAKKGSFLQDLEETDPLRLYLEELALIPVCGDIRLLADRLEKANREGTEDAALWPQILNSYLSRVVELACGYTGRGVLLMDLIQEGSMGLWQGMSSYHGGDFEAFCDGRISRAMAKTVTLQAHADGVGQKMRRAMGDYRAVDERLLTELGRNPTLEEIAEAMHLSPEEAQRVAQAISNARNISRAVPTPEPEEEDREEQMAVEDTAYFQMRQRISELLSILEPEEAKLLTLRFGLEGGLPLSPEETGRKLGLTAEEVVAKEAAALAKLRK